MSNNSSPNQTPRKVSDFGSGIQYLKPAEHLHEKHICLGFEFRETQFGEGYNLLCASAETGEVCRFTGKHARIMDRLKYVIKSSDNCPFGFIFVNVGTPAKPVYDMEDWD
jgi:hypothetical protein